MGIDDFDELVRAKSDLAEAERRNAALEKKLRALVACGTHGNCPPDRCCGRGVRGNCRECWLGWCGLEPLPYAGVKREREREREDFEEQVIWAGKHLVVRFVRLAGFFPEYFATTAAGNALWRATQARMDVTFLGFMLVVPLHPVLRKPAFG